MRGFTLRGVKVVCLLVGFSVALDAQSIEELMMSGSELLNNGAYSHAATKFKQALGRNPGNFEAQFNLALTYLNWGKNSSAVAEFKKAVALEPRSSEAWANMGVAYQNMGNTQKAINAISRAVNLDPGNISARLNLASMYASLKHYNQAIAQFKQVVAMDGTNTVAFSNLAKLLVASNKIDEATRYLREALANDPRNADAHWELGKIYWTHEKDVAKAEKSFRTAIEIEPTSQNYYYDLGRLLESEGRKDEAIDVYKSYLVYIDDALKKEAVQKRIEKLQNPDGTTTLNTEEEEVRFEMKGAQDIQKLKSELRPEEEEEEVSTMDVGTLDIMGDLEGLGSDTVDQSGGAFNLKEEAKKRAEK